MKIKQIKIKNFGKFSDKVFDFTSNQVVFYGENEAGKSTLVAFIIQIMFGFPNKTTKKKQYHPSPMPSIFGGEIIFSDDGSRYTLKRYLNKKTEGDFSVFKDEQEVPASVFFSQVKDINELFYQQNFIFNQDTLQNIYGVSEEELMQQIYYLGVTNSKQWLQLSRDKAKNAADIYRPRGRKQPLNQEIAKYQELTQTLQDKREEFKTYQSYQAQLEENQARLNDLQQQSNQLVNYLSQQKQIKEKFSLLEDYQKLEQRLDISQKSFKNSDYQKVQELKLTLTQLNTQVKQAKQDLEATQLTDDNQLQETLNQWPEVQYSYQEYKRVEGSLNQKENDLTSMLDYTPQIQSIAQLTDEQAQQSQQQLDDFKSQPNSQQNSQTNLMIGIVGYFAAVVGGFINPVITLILAIMATIFIVIHFKTNGRGAQKRREEAENKVFSDYLKSYQFSDSSTINGLNEAFEKRTYFKRLTAQIEQDKQAMLEQSQYVTAFMTKLGLEENIAQFDLLRGKVIQLQQQQAEFKQQENAREMKLNNLELLQNQKQTVQSELNQILVQNQFETVEDFEKAYQTHIQAQEDNVRLNAIKKEIGSLWEDVQQYKENKYSQDQEFDSKEQHYEELKQQQITVQKAIATLTAKQDLLTNDQGIFDLKQQIALQKEVIDQLIADWLTQELTSEVIMKMLDIASANRFPNMIERSQKYFEILTMGRYHQIKFTKSSIQVVTKDNQKYAVSDLSRGTAEQLYFSLKFAFIEQISDMISLPIVIDDAFVNFDDQRTKMIQQLLDEIAKYNQVFIFTARQKIKSLFKSRTIIELN
ncbi:AAA family ATPase [Holzapfeliella sp. He02]|uniref:AAA family ATPase n=1 Tax=Holzapfeliella saturejae TaxID=3082953 RepID=A0ABU8SH07_9LACO